MYGETHTQIHSYASMYEENKNELSNHNEERKKNS